MDTVPRISRAQSMDVLSSQANIAGYRAVIEAANTFGRLFTGQVTAADIVITTANIPGRKSPALLTAADVAAMKPGSVIVDMAAANGGNCELTVPGEITVTDNGVSIIGYTALAGRLPAQVSQLYGQNVVNLLKLMTSDKDGQLTFDLEDEIVRGITVTHSTSAALPAAASSGKPSNDATFQPAGEVA